MAEIYKRVNESILFSHQFRREDGDGWLSETETIATPTVKIFDRLDGTDYSSTMISNVAVVEDTQIQYRVSLGTEGKSYIVEIKAETSVGNTFIDELILHVK